VRSQLTSSKVAIDAVMWIAILLCIQEVPAALADAFNRQSVQESCLDIASNLSSTSALTNHFVLLTRPPSS
jgi:hypothetical protein